MHIYKFKVDKDYSRLKLFLLDIGLSHTTIKNLSKELGLVKVNGKPIVMNDKVKKNSIIEIYYKEFQTNDIVPTFQNLNIVYEDEYFLIVYKPHNIATIPSYCNYKNSLANFVTFYMKQKEGSFVYRAVNRLDKETSGFILVCKDAVIYNLLDFHKIQKTYEVIAVGKLKKCKIDKKIASTKNEDNRNNIIREIDERNGKKSQTIITKTKYNKKSNTTYAQIKILTGRTHQIRVHLKSIGTPILGDTLYGEKKADRMYLNCFKLKFYHPIKDKHITLTKHAFKNYENVLQ